MNLLINEFNAKIRSTLSNMLVFLHSDPIVSEERFQEIVGIEWDKYQIKIPSFFKRDMIEILGNRSKALNVKFAPMTKQSLEEAVNYGCRILYLGAEMISEEGLIVEDTDHKPLLLTFDDLETLFHKQRVRSRTSIQKEIDEKPTLFVSKPKIDLIIIGSRKGAWLAEWLSETVSIAHVVHFEFNRVPEIGEYRRKLYEQEYILKFTQFFMNELVAGQTVQESFDVAVDDTLSCLSHSFFNHIAESKLQMLIGKGAIILPTQEPNQRDKPLFEYGDYILQPGKIEDLSTQRSPTNLRKSIVPFIGRAEQFSKVIEFLGNYTSDEPPNIDGFLQINGEEGVGKTKFVLEVGWYVYQRNLFPDGVFYIPLRKAHKVSVYTLVDRLSRRLGGTKDRNYANFFRKKKMLMILDDFDGYLTNKAEFPELIFSMIKKFKIPAIVTTTIFDVPKDASLAIQTAFNQYNENKSNIEASYIAQSLELPRLTPEDMGNLMISLTNPFIGKTMCMSFTQAVEHKFQSMIFNGVPARLVNVLQEQKLYHDGELLEISRYYEPFQQLDKRQHSFMAHGQEIPGLEDKIMVFAVSRHSHTFLEAAQAMNETPTHSKSEKRKASKKNFPESPKKKEKKGKVGFLLLVEENQS